MSFVDHHGEVEYPYSQKTVFNALLAASKKIDGLKLNSADEISGRVIFKAGVSLRSWGEIIPVQLVCISSVRTRLQIMSTPKTGVMFGGAMDLGKNRQNIERIIKAVSDELAGKEPEIENMQLYVADELLKLKNLLDQGILTQEEFNEQKNKVLSTSTSPTVSSQTNDGTSNSIPSSTLSNPEPVRIESESDNGNNIQVWAIIAAIAFSIFMMLIFS